MSPACADQMANPTTLPTTTATLETHTPEDGLVAPLTIREIESWTQHSWDLEPVWRICAALDAAHNLLGDVSGDAARTLRVHRLIDWLEDCLHDALLPEQSPQQ